MKAARLVLEKPKLSWRREEATQTFCVNFRTVLRDPRHMWKRLGSEARIPDSESERGSGGARRGSSSCRGEAGVALYMQMTIISRSFMSGALSISDEQLM
ncbi:hypothetical protein E2C01_063295 [Portunus trituberculatus]|uniref:Uncharacterized protein n=1 Tax=Portunus trituberculatus TaxID=210409 RepID=A0A5B7HA31_PORTR|nr:hypothetical protein [Portunus trituberculatus]